MGDRRRYGQCPQQTIAFGEMRASKTEYVVLGLSLFLGASIWILSPLITGHEEAFDAGAYYWIALLAAGMIPALLEPRRFYIWPLPVIGGQILFTLPATLNSPFGPLGWIFILILSPVIFVGSFVGFLTMKVVSRIKGAGAGQA